MQPPPKAKTALRASILSDPEGIVCPYLLFRQFQYLTRVQHVALEAVQLHDLRIARPFAKVRLRDLPERVAVIDDFSEMIDDSAKQSKIQSNTKNILTLDNVSVIIQLL